ncbi:hypothetical protein ACFQ5F_12215 [Kroppenstedtia eburnea]|uniref:hypothetical protein n=1 Tax=Kroppenstedtia eburnea TaxID=714067 RepID=UPI00363C227D
MSLINKVHNLKKGNVTTLWLGGLPIFILIFLFTGNLVMVWLSHSNSQMAGDSGSLAATKKLDQWVKSEYNSRMQAIIRQNEGKLPGDPGYRDPYFTLFGTDEKKDAFIRGVIQKHKGDLASYTRKYVKKSGGDSKGVIIFSPDGRAQVRAQTKFVPLVFEEYFDVLYVKGGGVGPKRDYLTWLFKKERIEY